MNILREIRDSDIFSGAENHDPSDFAEKATSRIILLNTIGQIALLNVREYNYHKLPGGGMEGDESPERALQRELLEE